MRGKEGRGLLLALATSLGIVLAVAEVCPFAFKTFLFFFSMIKILKGEWEGKLSFRDNVKLFQALLE